MNTIQVRPFSNSIEVILVALSFIVFRKFVEEGRNNNVRFQPNKRTDVQEFLTAFCDAFAYTRNIIRAWNFYTYDLRRVCTANDGSSALVDFLPTR